MVRGTSTGTCCVAAPGLAQASLPVLTSVDWSGSVTSAHLTAFTDERSPSPFCPAGRFAVYTFADFEDAAAPAPRNDISFSVLIP